MISIIIPTLNEEKIIRTTLTSLKRLTLPHEIIVSDGNSKDATVAIAKELGVTVFEHTEPRRQNIAEGRNVGGRNAQGEYVVFMDADCSIADPDTFFTEVLKIFDTKTNVVAISPNIKVLPEFETFADKVIMGIMNISYRMMTNVLHIPAAPGEFQIIRKRVFDEVKGFNEKLTASEDIEFFNRASKHGKALFANNLTVWHTGRRAHKVGWPKLLWSWFRNTISMLTSGKSASEEWTPIR